jgi:hypothetical protein
MDSVLTQSSISPSSYSLSPTSFQQQQLQQQQTAPNNLVYLRATPNAAANSNEFTTTAFYQTNEQQQSSMGIDFGQQNQQMSSNTDDLPSSIDLESLLVNTRLSDNFILSQANLDPPLSQQQQQHQQQQQQQQLGNDDDSTVVNNNINPMFLFKSGATQNSSDLVYIQSGRAQSGSGTNKYRNINPNKIDEEDDMTR